MYIRRGSKDPKALSSKDKDPWLENDPWKEARRPIKSFKAPPTLQLMPEALCHADGTSPNLVEKLAHGTTRIAIVTPVALLEWSDVAKPVSPDELSALVFPPLKEDEIPPGWTPALVEFPDSLEKGKQHPC